MSEPCEAGPCPRCGGTLRGGTQRVLDPTTNEAVAQFEVIPTNLVCLMCPDCEFVVSFTEDR